VLEVAPRALEIEPPVTHAAEPARATPITARVEPVLHHAADRERPAEERHVWVELVDLPPANVGAPAEMVARAAEVNVDASAQRRSWAAGAPHQPVHAHTSRAHTLTGREIEIAQMVGERKSNKAIGDALAISPRTVSTHLTNIFRKLDVTTRAELAEYVTKHRGG
jgi:DNA-binding CsgD family transcriptional regulator